MTVVIRDNFFPSDFGKLIAESTRMFQWQYHHKSDVSNKDNNKFFLCQLWDRETDENLFYKSWQNIQQSESTVGGYVCDRIIANGQVFGQDGNYHTDHLDKTILYFPLTWESGWGGSTFFSVNGQASEVEYRENRLLIFDANLSHYGSAPAVKNILRVSIAYNLRLVSGKTPALVS